VGALSAKLLRKATVNDVSFSPSVRFFCLSILQKYRAGCNLNASPISEGQTATESGVDTMSFRPAVFDAHT